MNLKILIMLVGILGIVFIGWCIQEKPKNFEFEYKEYKEYNVHLFNLSSDYKQYLKEGTVDEKLKNVFEDNNVLLPINARVQQCTNPNYWEINDNGRTYIIGDTSTGKPLEVRDIGRGGYIKNIIWENKVLIIESIVTATCDDPNLKLFGDYKVDENNISLTISETTSFFFHYQCAGSYKVKFKIKNLKKQNYNILLFTDVMGQGKLLVDEKLFTNDTLYPLNFK